MIAPLGFVLVMSFGVNRLSRQGAQGLFWAFCATMGASMASIFLVYTGVSVVRVFLVTACTFAATSLWGYTTKANLLKFSSFLMMGLFGLVIAGLVNIFLKSSAMYFVYSIIGCSSSRRSVRLTPSVSGSPIRNMRRMKVRMKRPNAASMMR